MKVQRRDLWLIALVCLVLTLTFTTLASAESSDTAISGRVTDEVTGGGLAGITVSAYVGTSTVSSGSAITADGSVPGVERGSYVIPNLPEGQYKVRTFLSGYVDEWYANVIYATDLSGASATLVSPSASDVDFALQPGETIAGKVTDEANNALASVQVTVRTASTRVPVNRAFTDANGNYSVSGLPAGVTYVVRTMNAPGHVDEWFDNVPYQTDMTATGATRMEAPNTDVNFALAVGETISGRVTDEQTGNGLQVTVQARDLGGYTRSTAANADGTYVIAGLLPGQYKVRTQSLGSYLDEWYNNVPVPNPGDVSGVGATLVSASATGIDFALTSRNISGRVTDAETGAALSDVILWLYSEMGDAAGYAATDSQGYYHISPWLSAGRYRLRTSNSAGYVDEWYNNVAYLTDWAGTTAALVPPGSIDVNFALEPGQTISGRVTDEETTAGLSDVVVCTYTEAGLYGPTASTDADGYYTISGLPSARWKVVTLNSQGYLDEWYNNVLYVLDYSGAHAALVPSAATGIDFALHLAEKISGRVTDEETDAGLPDVYIWAYDEAGNVNNYGYTDADGNFTISGLVPGSYRLLTYNWQGYFDEWFDNVQYQNDPGGAEATLVPGGSTGIGFALSTHLAPHPVLTLEKSGSWVDTDDSRNWSVGDEIGYHFVVSNRGNVDIEDITVSDPTATVTGQLALLPVGGSDSTTFSATHVITADDVAAGEIVNTATVTGRFGAVEVTAQGTATVWVPLPLPPRPDRPGSIIGWGANDYGQASPPEGHDYVAIAAGGYHSLALKSDGSIVGWGVDWYGESTPPEGTDYLAIAAGYYHSLALRSDGSIVGWGSNFYGESTPPEGHDYVAIAASGYHSLALKSDGSIVAWGVNPDGQATPPEGHDYVAIGTGVQHSLALKSDGSIVGWGVNGDGQASPPEGHDYVAIAAGSTHSLALKSDGSIVGWGSNWYGESTPPAGTDYVAIAACWYSLALKSDGSIIAWGDDDTGQIECPSGNRFVAVSTSGWHSLALNTSIPPSVSAVSVAPVPVNTEVSASASFTDPEVDDTHTALWDWGDGTEPSAGVISESNGAGTVSGTHTYSAVGMYTVRLTVTDNNGAATKVTYEPMVVYDPVRFVTADGWITSPPGAYPANYDLTGKATLGFSCKYVKGSSVPVGTTAFRFGAAQLTFVSTSYDWLQVNGAIAQYQGSGTLNGNGDYAFRVTAFDGQVDNAGAPDQFRIRIWDKGSGDILYDNEMNNPDDPLALSTPLGHGSVAIQRGGKTGQPTPIGLPYAGTRFYYSGSGSGLDNSMTKSVLLPAGATLTAKVNYEMEYFSDWAYLTVNGEAVRTNVSVWGEAITGSSWGNWVDLTADLSAYGGQTVTLGFSYLTGGSIVYKGLMIDEISIAGGKADGAEKPAGWTFNGFRIATAKDMWLPSY